MPGINWSFGLDPVTGRPKVNPAMIAQSGGPEVGPIIPSLEGGQRLAAPLLQSEAQLRVLPLQPVGDGDEILGGREVSAADKRGVVSRRRLSAVSDE